jgi:hypothetical protein
MPFENGLYAQKHDALLSLDAGLTLFGSGTPPFIESIRGVGQDERPPGLFFEKTPLHRPQPGYV